MTVQPYAGFHNLVFITKKRPKKDLTWSLDLDDFDFLVYKSLFSL